ncbi:hypothetical protein BH23GEM11_BH23GEM11_09550 [soil metagenome]
MMITRSSEPAIRDLVLEVVRLRRSGGGRSAVVCPRCGGAPCHRWGAFSGRQRYRCSSCKRTFSDLTGTFLARCRRIERWPLNLAAMEKLLSVRMTAREAGVSPSTAFRWRHRILDARRSTVRSPWSSQLLGDCTPVSIRQNARCEARVWVLGVIGRDRGQRRSEARLLAIAAREVRPNTDMLVPAIATLADQGCRVRDGRGRFGGVSLAGRRLGMGAGRTGIRDLRPLIRLLRGVRPFLRPFRGVSLRWLQNYLEWNLMLRGSTPAPPTRVGERPRGPPVALGLRFLRLVL